MMYKGEFKDGHRNGLGLQIFSNGQSYDGNWIDGKREGHGTMTWPFGQKY